MRLIVTHGLPGSGKSTWAQEQVDKSSGSVVRVNRDDIRSTVFGEEYHKKAPDKNCEMIVSNIHRNLMLEAWGKGKTVICDDTNLNPRFFKDLVKFAKEHNVVVEQEYFDVPVDVCLERNKKRGDAGGRFVPPEIIERMASNAYTAGKLNRFVVGGNGNVYNVPQVSEGGKLLAEWSKKQSVYDNGKSIVIVDVDGTLAMNNEDAEKYLPRTGKKNFHKFFKNIENVPVNSRVVDLVNNMVDRDGLTVIILTGRSDEYAGELVRFLDRSGVKASRVIAKSARDYRPDNEFKQEVIEGLLREGNVIVHAVDDRPRSIQVFKDNNILVSVVDENYNVDSIYGSGVCLRCGKPLKNGNIGPVCRTR